jgi:DNA-binding CsgD family transcriptional regulator
MARALVGRDAELARLHAWLAARLDPGLSSTEPPVLFVAGEAGVGKTALLEAVSIPEGTSVRWAAAAPFHLTPYGLLRQLVADVREPEAVRAALRAEGEALLVVLDDLHWSDDATLALLPALADAVRADPIAILGAYRGDELPRGHRLRPVRAQLRPRRQLAEVALGPLSTDALAQLIAGRIGARPSPALTTTVAERTEGLPFFAEELIAALDTTGWLINRAGVVDLAAGDDLPLPESIRDAVLLRVSTLTPAARSALDVAAVAGPELDVDTVAALAGGWPDELDHSGLVVGSGPKRRFRHALVHEAVYADIPWTRRRSLHRALADRLTATPVLAARHLVAAQDYERARPALIAAAAAHRDAYAYRDAGRLLALALESWPAGTDEVGRLAAVDALARCAELSGDHTAAVTGLRELADRSAEPDVRATVHRRLAAQYEQLGHWPPALAAREEAALAFTAAGAPAEAAAEYLAVAAHLRSAGSFRAALESLDSADRAARSADRADLVCRIGGLRGNVFARQGRADGVATVQTALTQALDHGLTAAAAEIYQRLADSLEHAGDYRSAGQAYDRAYDFCSHHGEESAGQLCRACATVVLFHCGQWDRALRLCAEVLANAASPAHARAVVHGVGGLVLAWRGNPVAARSTLLESQSIARRIDLVAMELLSLWGLAVLDEAAGRLDRAAENYRQIVARSQATEERHYGVPALMSAAACFADQGSTNDLAAATAILSEAAGRSGQPEARAALTYALGETVRLQSGPEAALEHLRAALELLAGLDLPLADALVRRRLAAALAAAGALEEAAGLLRGAQRTAQRLKARPLADQIRRELDPHAPTTTGAATSGLSPREAEVLTLVGQGLTSREIGKRLYLSVRTVDMHVRNGVARLGCRTRAEAVRRLAGPT